ncbi:putative RNA-directed DNA polymerase, eukaryota, reverse transcriptase zinc-binding domain protein [Tanacetum coccineum]
MKWELEAEYRSLNEEEMLIWMEARRLCVEKEREKVSMLKQKARVRWDVEGDENTKFFHSFVKRRNNKNNIRGLLVDGVWCEEPNNIKKEMEIIKADIVRVVKWFGDRMEISRGCNASFVTIIPKVADPIRLGDFRPISLIGCYYKIISKMLAERVKKVIGNVVGDVQNAFIKGRYILDGILVANETVEFIKRKKEKGLVFKVNGSPTEEFGLERGVRQGDPLSPFLFILEAEGLNAIISEAVDKEWNKENAKSKIYGCGLLRSGEIIEMARWMGCGVGEFPFTYLGLPIGVCMRRTCAWNPVVEKFKKRLADWKAKTMSFGGRLPLVKSVLGSLPLYYFSMFSVPASVIKNLESIPSHGFGGLNIGSLRAKNLALLGKWWWRFKTEGESLWVRVIKSIHGKSGGLEGHSGGRGSVRGGGVWRDITRVGAELEGLGLEFVSSFVGVVRNGNDIRFWVDKWVGGVRLCDKFPRLYHLDGSKYGKVAEKGKWVDNNWCWEWVWVRNFRRRVCKDFEELQELLHNVVIKFDCRDSWRWTLKENGDFAVRELSKLVEEKTLSVDSGGESKIWNKWVQKKVNIFVWRALKGRLPVRKELDKRGIDLDSLLCPSCGDMVESRSHCLVMCNFARSVWEKYIVGGRLGWLMLFQLRNSFHLMETLISLVIHIEYGKQ